MAIKIAKTTEQLREFLHETDSDDIGFVPTMGALHKGHLALVGRAREQSRVVVVSIFINPTQFNDPEDLKNYPRTPKRDLELLDGEGVDILFMPSVEQVYPEPDDRQFNFGPIDKVMEGGTRPGHFNGVAQVVSRLFELINPTRAYFGEKDFQQVAVIKAMVKQLGFKTKIVTCPTTREMDGLAMSSRNTRLTPRQREVAPRIYEALSEWAKLVAEGGREYALPPREVEQRVIDRVNREPELKVIYFKLVNASTLQEAESWNEPEGVQGCIAVQVGEIRLIDNIRYI